MNGPKFRLVSDGKHSYFEVCGKSMGKGVSSVIGDLSDREPSSKNGPSEENELSPIITAE